MKRDLVTAGTVGVAGGERSAPQAHDPYGGKRGMSGELTLVVVLFAVAAVSGAMKIWRGRGAWRCAPTAKNHDARSHAATRSADVGARRPHRR